MKQWSSSLEKEWEVFIAARDRAREKEAKEAKEKAAALLPQAPGTPTQGPLSPPGMSVGFCGRARSAFCVVPDASAVIPRLTHLVRRR